MEKQLQKTKLGSAPQQVNDSSPSILLGLLQVPLCVNFKRRELSFERMMDKSTSIPGSAAWWYAYFQLLGKVCYFSTKALVTKLEILWNWCWKDLEVILNIPQLNRSDRRVRDEQYIKAQGSWERNQGLSQQVKMVGLKCQRILIVWIFPGGTLAKFRVKWKWNMVRSQQLESNQTWKQQATHECSWIYQRRLSL